MFQLKDYQKKTLNILEEYLNLVRFKGSEGAFHELKQNSIYNKIAGLEDVPYVCLRLPTGGGKTYLSANTIPIVSKNYLETETPIVLWCCPTKTIKTQTIETLKNPRHPNREVLEQSFGSDIAVYDIADFTDIKVQDIGEKCCIFVATFQTSRVQNTDIRKIYAHHENLEPIFRKIPNLNNRENLERIEEGADKGKVKYSLANLLNIYRPIVIADEAHNNVTPLAYNTFVRFNPSCIIEYTATPDTNSNVLYRVCAMELKSEEMIKLPIILTVHQTWEQSLTAAIQTRKGLGKIASNDKDYIRPIMLIQAESKDKEITVDVIKKYLIEQENIDENKIAIATGEQRELDDKNLFDPKCSIEYIITVEALKEGWDCSFAYVFCSVAQRHSPKDIEQLLGRVLRMPYAKSREQSDLNKAYAFVSNVSWQEGVSQLKDRLVEMGFEENEIPDSVQTHLPETLGGHIEIAPIKFNVSNFDMNIFTSEEQKHIEVVKTPIGHDVYIKQATEITTEMQEKIVKAVPIEERQTVATTMEIELRNRIIREIKTPSQKGETFLIPQLSLFVDNDWISDYDEYFLDPSGKWLLEYPATLNEGEFRIQKTGTSIEIDLNGNRIEDRYIQSSMEYEYMNVPTDWTIPNLAIWITKQIPDTNIPQQVQVTYIRQLLENLCINREISLNDLVRTKFILKDAIKSKIQDCKNIAEQKGMQTVLFAPFTQIKTDFNYCLDFAGKPYIPPKLHIGTVFNHHYYYSVGCMNGEEIECARALDTNDNIAFWVRNIEKYQYAFYIPKANGRFYPDFIAKLKDGRILVVEYKGEHLIDYTDTKNKALVGELWEKSSSGKCLFLMGVKKNNIGSIYEQISNKIAKNS